MDKPTIMVPDMCKKHQSLLVHQANYKPDDSWRVLIVAAQIALFQAATTDPKTHEKIGDDITKIGELGCLACYKPDAFGSIAETAKYHDIKEIKALGEKWLQDSKGVDEK